METVKKSERVQNKNLIPFKPGKSGNPKGRPPKGYSITEAFKSMFTANPEVKAQVVESIKDKALKGDPTAQKLLWNYMDGMPPQAPEDPGSPDNPIHHAHHVYWE